MGKQLPVAAVLAPVLDLKVPNVSCALLYSLTAHNQNYKCLSKFVQTDNASLV